MGANSNGPKTHQAYFLNRPCSQDSFLLQGESAVVTISGYKDVPQNSEESLLKALANQPLSVAIEASGRDFQFYSGVSIFHYPM